MGFEPKTNRSKAKGASRENSGLSRLISGNNDQAGTVADWGTVKAATVLDLVLAITTAGGAVRFGYSRDGGAYSLGLYLGDDHETMYFKPYEDVDAKLTELTDKIRNL